MADASYERLPGRTRIFAGVATLWLGDGHLLQASNVLGVENYRRWYLREIQAVIVRRTGRRVMWNVIWGVLGGLALAVAGGLAGLATTNGKGEGQTVFYVMAGIAGTFAAACAAGVLWNSLLGPGCTVFLQTPAGLQPLATPARVRPAEALLARLRPLIEEAQLPK